MTTYEEQRKQRLMTVLSAAVRIGRVGALPDSVVAAELGDLAELYLAAAHVPYGVIGTGATALTIHNPDFKNMQVRQVDAPPFVLSDEIRQSILDQAAQLVKEQTGAAAETCGVELVDPVGGHAHICNKTPGHADGPGGSDHQCDVCGALFPRVTDGMAEGEAIDL